MRSSATRPRLCPWLALLALGIALVGGWVSPVLAQTLLIYQANPAPGSGLPSLDRLSYDALQRFTATAANESGKIAQAVGFTGPTAIEIVPGGYKLRSDPSIVMHVKALPRQASLLAAALGYAYRQDSVLVLDLDALDADQFFVRISFPGSTLTGALADAFFRHAAQIDPALGAGYTAFDNDLVFINLRDDSGKPYGGLDDDRFKAALAKATTSFAPAKAIVDGTGQVEARLIGNDWRARADGWEYRTLLPLDALPALDGIAAAIASQMRDAAIKSR